MYSDKFTPPRFNTSQTEQIRMRLHVPMGVKVVHPLRQPAAVNYCSNKTCSHYCLLTCGAATCLCPEVSELLICNF